MSDWGLLTNHARVLLCVARDSNFRLRDIAECVGLTERATHRIICDLCEAGYVTRHRAGRRNSYELHPHVPLRGSLEGEAEVGELLSVLMRPRSEPAPVA